ncbi:MAG: MarR family winged helix-turn-helix transcriptional regulator [Bacilli bacterium]
MDLLKLENQLCFPLYVASKEIVKKYGPFLKELDLTYTQYIVMMVLWEKKEISAKELGKILYLDSGTITPVIKRLEKYGLVTRERSKEDERSLVITITKAGEDLKIKAKDIPNKISDCINISQDEAVLLYKLLYKILDE